MGNKMVTSNGTAQPNLRVRIDEPFELFQRTRGRHTLTVSPVAVSGDPEIANQ